MAPKAKTKGTAEHGNQGPEGWQGPAIFLFRMGFVGGNYRVFSMTQSKTIRNCLVIDKTKYFWIDQFLIILFLLSWLPYDYRRSFS